MIFQISKVKFLIFTFVIGMGIFGFLKIGATKTKIPKARVQSKAADVGPKRPMLGQSSRGLVQNGRCPRLAGSRLKAGDVP